MIIGAPISASSWYRVSRDHLLVSPFLRERCVGVIGLGKHRCSLELQFSEDTTVRPFPANHPSRPMVFV